MACFPRPASARGRGAKTGRTRDWLVIYFHQDRGQEGQRTVVTETRGPATGHRVIWGREAECVAPLERA